MGSVEGLNPIPVVSIDGTELFFYLFTQLT